MLTCEEDPVKYGILEEKKKLSFTLKITEIGDNGKNLFTKIPNPG